MHGGADGIRRDAQHFTAGGQDLFQVAEFFTGVKDGVDLRRQERRHFFQCLTQPRAAFDMRGDQEKVDADGPVMVLRRRAMAGSTGWPRCRTVSSRSRKKSARSRRCIGSDSRKCSSTANAPPGNRIKTVNQKMPNKTWEKSAHKVNHIKLDTMATSAKTC